VVLAERDQEVQALPVETAESSLTIRVCLRRLNRRAEDPNTHGGDGRIEPGRVDPVPSVEDEPVGVRRGEDFPERRQGPGGRRVARDVDGHAPSAPHREGHADGQKPERGGHRHAAVAGQQGVSVVPDEGGPALPGGPRPSSAPPAGHVPTHGARRDAETELEESSSAAMRSSPHVGVLRAIAAIRRWRSAGSRGRPEGDDRQRQRSRKAWRCQRVSVASWTSVSASRQAKQRASRTSARRIASEARRGFTGRSRYNTTCFRRKRFSAANATWERSAVPKNISTSPPSPSTTRPRCRHPSIVRRG